jgi:hypothetical protein
MEAIHDLRLVCGDLRLPADLTEIPHQPEPRPIQKPLDLSPQIQQLEDGGWQGSVWCDGHQVQAGPVRTTRAAAEADAEEFAEKVTTSVINGVLEDIGHAG